MVRKHVTDTPLSQHHPKSWHTQGTMPLIDSTVIEFRNLEHFKNTVSDLTQKVDDTCGVSYKQALVELKQGKPTILQEDYQVIKQKVKESLLKRNLISENIYEGYKYSIEGELIDIARYLEGNPECMLVPKSKGKHYFYEMYLNISVAGSMSGDEMNRRLAQVLATIELLEQERIYIKLNIVDTSGDVNTGEGKPHLLTILPVFSHREHKCIEKLSSVANERLLRKFMFALSEALYGNDLSSGYGTPLSLPNCLNIQDNLDVCEVAANIIGQLITPCKRR